VPRFPSENSRAATVAGLVALGILLILILAAIMEDDPDKDYIRARLGLRSKRTVNLLVAGGCIRPGIPAHSEQNQLPFSVFAQHLQNAYPGSTVNVVQPHKSDSTAAELAALLPDSLRRHRPQITVICLGGADYLRGTAIAEYAQHCRSLFSQASDSGGFVIVLFAALPETDAAAQLAATTRHSAADAGIACVDFAAVLRHSGIPMQTLCPNDATLSTQGILLLANALGEIWRLRGAQLH